MKNIKVSYRITTKGGGWSKFNSIIFIHNFS